MKCPNCGITLRENEKICGVCGAPVPAEPAPPAYERHSDLGFTRRSAYNAYESEDRPYRSDNGYDDRRPDNYGDDNRYEADRRAGDRRPDDYYVDDRYETDRRYDGDPRYDDRVDRNRCGNQTPPKNNKKKALIISIIALIVVISILAGVIIGVNLNTVSAAELQDAKDKYLPPAQAVTIDASLDDPSNDQIQFKYDDRARITSCTYSANDKTYDQSYSYDDALRKIHIETNYRKHPIFTKDINYDVVEKPNTFEAHDGYYIRLGDDLVKGNDNTDTSSATDAPDADEPTDEATEEPTEEPTEASSDWRDLYIDFLSGSSLEYNFGGLIYLNDDDTPELLLTNGPSGGFPKEYYLCWISGSEVSSDTIPAREAGNYQSGSGYIKTMTAHAMNSGWSLYYFDGSNCSLEHEGSMQISYDSATKEKSQTFKIDDAEVSEEEYSEYDDVGSGSALPRDSEKDSLPDYIRSFS